jgi:hypothetical protein
MKKRVVAAVALLVSPNLSANVIFPAFATPYLAPIFFPLSILAVLLTEGAVYKLLCRSLGLGTIAVLVICVNAISWLAGVLLANFLPSGLILDQGAVRNGPEFGKYMYWSFPVAYMLSVLIEGGALKLASRKVPIPAPFKLSFWANTASYVVLALSLWAYAP